MDKFWYGAYIYADINQIGIKHGVLNTVSSFAPAHAGLISPEQFTGLHQSAALKWNLIVVSPKRRGWIGLWGGTPAFQRRLFQNLACSGITLEMEDGRDASFWSYRLWQDGAVADWFISDPSQYFASWDDASVRNALSPYLKQQGYREDLPRGEMPTGFGGKTDILQRMQLMQRTDGDKDIAALFPNRPAAAFTAFLSGLQVPFNRLDFDPFNFGVYLDVQDGRVSLDERPELRPAYERAGSIPGLEDFSFLLLDLQDADHARLAGV